MVAPLLTRYHLRPGIIITGAREGGGGLVHPKNLPQDEAIGVGRVKLMIFPPRGWAHAVQDEGSE